MSRQSLGGGFGGGQPRFAASASGNNRRSTIAPTSSSSSSTMSDRSALSSIDVNANGGGGNASTSNKKSASQSRQSMGGRQSIAPTSNASSSSSSRQSMGGTSSSASSSRQSMGGAGFGAGSSIRRASVDRRSAGGTVGASSRRSSVGASSARPGTALGQRSDPRSFTGKEGKELMRANILKTIMFLTTYHYDHQLSPKQLAAPSTKDFKNIILFLFQKLDANFQFPSGVAPAGNAAALSASAALASMSFEDSVKLYMKRFGYPFAISKSALQAAGSPHTWPALLAMLVWIQEVLQYHEAVHGSSSSSASSSASSAQDTEQKMFFEYSSGAYLAFLQGEDNFDAHDSALARRFDSKNLLLTDELRRLDLRLAEATQTILENQEQAETMAEIAAYVRSGRADMNVMENNIRQNQAHMELVQSKKSLRTAEVASLTDQLALAKGELAEASKDLAAQPFTPMQVQEMLHQKAMMEASLLEQARQMSALQSETWLRETECSEKVSNVEKQVREFNELSLAVERASIGQGQEKGKYEYAHVAMCVNLSASDPNAMLGVDLKAQKDSITMLRESLSVAKRELHVASVASASLLAELEESSAESAARLGNLSARVAKVSELYSSERAKLHAKMDAACAEVEDVELRCVTLRNDIVAADVADTQRNIVYQLDAQSSRSYDRYRQEQKECKDEICAMMEQMTNHKCEVTERLEIMLDEAMKMKEAISKEQGSMNKYRKR